jgi:hypothetical protein
LDPPGRFLSGALKVPEPQEQQPSEVVGPAAISAANPSVVQSGKLNLSPSPIPSLTLLTFSSYLQSSFIVSIAIVYASTFASPSCTNFAGTTSNAGMLHFLATPGLFDTSSTQQAVCPSPPMSTASKYASQVSAARHVLPSPGRKI